MMPELSEETVFKTSFSLEYNLEYISILILFLESNERVALVCGYKKLNLFHINKLESVLLIPEMLRNHVSSPMEASFQLLSHLHML